MATKVLMPKKSAAYQGRGISNDGPKIPDRGAECWVVWDESIWPTTVTVRRYQGPYRYAHNAPTKSGYQAIWLGDLLRYRLASKVVREIPHKVG